MPETDGLLDSESRIETDILVSQGNGHRHINKSDHSLINNYNDQAMRKC